MELVFGIVLLLTSFLMILFLSVAKEECEDFALYAVLGAVVASFLIAGTYLICEYCSPSITPMDVYRGKTTLEITYRDSIAIDSTVVWKKEVK